MTHGQVAGAVRRDKETHPEKYCSNKHCLWRLSSGPCRKHAPVGAVMPRAMEPDLEEVRR
jgi:hypothetical protein